MFNLEKSKKCNIVWHNHNFENFLNMLVIFYLWLWSFSYKISHKLSKVARKWGANVKMNNFKNKRLKPCEPVPLSSVGNIGEAGSGVYCILYSTYIDGLLILISIINFRPPPSPVCIIYTEGNLHCGDRRVCYCRL